MATNDSDEPHIDVCPRCEGRGRIRKLQHLGVCIFIVFVLVARPTPLFSEHAGTGDLLWMVLVLLGTVCLAGYCAWKFCRGERCPECGTAVDGKTDR